MVVRAAASWEEYKVIPGIRAGALRAVGCSCQDGLMQSTCHIKGWRCIGREGWQVPHSAAAAARPALGQGAQALGPTQSPLSLPRRPLR